MAIINYVLGFVFNTEFSKVLLIRKNRPSFMEGKLNGIGGKIEPGETPRRAMTREMLEEADINIHIGDWSHNGAIHGKDFYIDVFHATIEDIFEFKSLTDEVVSVHDVHDTTIKSEGVENLRFVIDNILKNHH